jgi:signal transduction histidine kinase
MMVISSIVVFLVVYVNTGTQIRLEIDTDLAGDTTQLSRALEGSHARAGAEVVAMARDYIAGQPYSATSTVFLVLVPGQPLISNQPSLFSGNGRPGSARARLAPRVLAVLRRPRVGYGTVHLPGAVSLRLLERRIRVGRIDAVVGAGEPLAAVTRARHGITGALVLVAVLSLVLALIASYLAGARAMAPLRRLAAVATRVNGGDLEPRMAADETTGEEVRVLAESFNGMLDRLSLAFASQRAFVADASHELRTPLTVIQGQLELLSTSAAPDAAEVHHVQAVVRAEISRISRLVDDMLLLAQADQAEFLRREWIALGPFLRDLWNGLSLTADRRFELALPPVGRRAAGELRADPDRLAQALRNLGRNAIEHTAPDTGLVRLEVDVTEGRVRFAVLDDGPGIPPGEREQVFERFHRVDPGRSRAHGGAGLGLAIVRAIARAHGGEVRAGDGPGGSGARVELVLPGYR